MSNNSFRRTALSLAGLGVLLTSQSAIRPAAADELRQYQQGKATYYANKFHGRRAANGERFSQNELVAAHPSLPFGSVVRVTNLRNSRTTNVRIIDRGPARGPQRSGVIIDLSRNAAQQLGFIAQGRTPVKLDIVRQGTKRGKIINGNREESFFSMY